MASYSLKTYAEAREGFLAQIVRTLSADERFVAAWLTGSFGRQDADAVSDLDLTVVVAAPYDEVLCVRDEDVSARVSPERLDLLSRFGQPVALHENHYNAPAGGTFTFTLYTPFALMVDWVLLPQSRARRPAQSRLLFEKASIPTDFPAEPESPEQRAREASNIIAFFWMMMAVAAKHIVRQDHVFVTRWLEELHRMVQEVERLVRGKAVHYQRGSLTTLETTSQGQAQVIRQLGSRMTQLMLKIVEIGGQVPASPMPMIEILLNLDPITGKDRR